MSLRELGSIAFDLVFRYLPHRASTGLLAIGDPDRQSPVLLTGNYTVTVRRLRRVLRGQRVWLLCANSKGINVWCAAGGGHLTHHDVIAAIRTSGIGERVEQRHLVLPQLSATGVERRRITEATGWSTAWGPARLEDLPAFLQRGGPVHKAERTMRFPLWERLEMAAMWSVPMAVLGGPLFAWLGGWRLGLALAAMALATVFTLFAALPALRVTGAARWITFGAFAVLGAALGGALLAALGDATPPALTLDGVAALGVMGILAIDLAGTTPWYGSYINTFHAPRIDLVANRCTGQAVCVQVCPRNVLAMQGALHKVEVARPDDCIQCGACIVQCPEDALRFRYDDGRIVEPATVRTTRMNMLGRRTVHIASDAGMPS
ncbi:MAG TPA: HgcAB-like fusion protein [bacterium]|nr:HgcAB-like fusion protein [bacterium]